MWWAVFLTQLLLLACCVLCGKERGVVRARPTKTKSRMDTTSPVSNAREMRTPPKSKGGSKESRGGSKESKGGSREAVPEVKPRGRKTKLSDGSTTPSASKSSEPTGRMRSAVVTGSSGVSSSNSNDKPGARSPNQNKRRSSADLVNERAAAARKLLMRDSTTSAIVLLSTKHEVDPLKTARDDSYKDGSSEERERNMKEVKLPMPTGSKIAKSPTSRSPNNRTPVAKKAQELPADEELVEKTGNSQTGSDRVDSVENPQDYPKEMAAGVKGDEAKEAKEGSANAKNKLVIGFIPVDDQAASKDVPKAPSKKASKEVAQVKEAGKEPTAQSPQPSNICDEPRNVMPAAQGTK